MGFLLIKLIITSNIRETLLGGGEAGKEAIAPIDKLQDYVRAAVQTENEGLADVIKQQFGYLISALERMIPKGVMLDSGTLVGELTPAIDAGLSTRWQHTQRGNVR